MSDQALVVRDALILEKARISSADVLQWEAAQFAAQYREWYRQAFAAKLIRRINFVLRAIGQEVAPGHFRWEYTRPDQRLIQAEYLEAAGTTFVTVGNLRGAQPVLDNRTPGAELFNPGDADGWLSTLESVYQQKKAEAAWTAEIEEQKAQTTKVVDFLASV